MDSNNNNNNNTPPADQQSQSTQNPASSVVPSSSSSTTPSEAPASSSQPVTPSPAPTTTPATPPAEQTPTPSGASSAPTTATPPPADGTPPAKKKNLLPFIALAALVVGLGFLAFWYYQSEMKRSNAVTVTPTPAEVTLSEKIVVGTDPTYPPMEYQVDEVTMGYDIDLANFLGKELGVDVQFKNIVFDDLFTALEQKKIDMIISTVTVTNERKEKYDFSEPYLQGGQVILTQKANTTITTTADLKGKKVAVQKGTTIESEALKYTSDQLVIRYPDFVEATAALVKGDVDAIFADLPGAKGITNDNPTLKIASDPFTNEYYAVVFRKGDPKIKEINEAIASLKVKGILTDLKQKWLDQ